MGLTDCFHKGLLVRVAADMDSARRSVLLARRYLADADSGMSTESYRVVIIMSYTAMFHAARAILYRDGVRERSHECIPLYLRERYPSLEPYANKLDSYRKSRHAAMYGLEFEPGRQDAITSLAVA